MNTDFAKSLGILPLSYYIEFRSFVKTIIGSLIMVGNILLMKTTAYLAWLIILTRKALGKL